MQVSFRKMNGAGNDFVVMDARQEPLALNFEQVRALASRGNAQTQGCDQVIVLEPSQTADVFMRIFNADGGEVDACGNATRCVGALLMRELTSRTATIATNAGMLRCAQVAFGVQADMGPPRFAPAEIPVSGEADAAALAQVASELGIEGVTGALCVGMGNPHVVFFVEALPDVAVLAAAGEKVKSLPLFTPYGVNLTVAEVRGDSIEALVYERGAGLTKSCGTAACATAVAAVSLGYRSKGEDVRICQRQRAPQNLSVRWDAASGHVFFSGAVEFEFEGVVDV